MVLLLTDQESEIKKNLSKFLKVEFKVKKILRYHKIYDNFAPDYYIKNRTKKRIIIFRNPPDFPVEDVGGIKNSIEQNIGVYIAVYEKDTDSELLNNLLDECDKYGVGVIRCWGVNNFKIMQKALNDYSIEPIIEDRIKIFISSKLFISERDISYKILKRLKHQPICIERIPITGHLTRQCLDWIDKSPFFIGILTPRYSEIVDKEMRYALKKKKNNCLICIDNACFSCKKNTKLENLKKFINKKTRFNRYGNCQELKTCILNQIPAIISRNIQ